MRTETLTRKVAAILAATACAVGLAVAYGPLAEAESTPSTSTKAAAAVLPTHGTYKGVDHAGRIITFSFAGNYMGHFAVNNMLIGGAHVGGSAWHETCHGGMCTKGTWVSDHHVQGSWRTRDGHWTTFSAYHQPVATINPYIGSYRGEDHAGISIHLMYRHGTIADFKLDHSVRGNIPVSNGRFNHCLPSVCVEGHWASDNRIVGKWKAVGSTHWFSWEVNAYSH